MLMSTYMLPLHIVEHIDEEVILNLTNGLTFICKSQADQLKLGKFRYKLKTVKVRSYYCFHLLKFNSIDGSLYLH